MACVSKLSPVSDWRVIFRPSTLHAAHAKQTPLLLTLQLSLLHPPLFGLFLSPSPPPGVTSQHSKHWLYIGLPGPEPQHGKRVPCINSQTRQRQGKGMP